MPLLRWSVAFWLLWWVTLIFFFFNSWDKLYSYSVMTFYPFVYVGFDLLKSQEVLTLWSWRTSLCSFFLCLCSDCVPGWYWLHRVSWAGVLQFSRRVCVGSVFLFPCLGGCLCKSFYCIHSQIQDRSFFFLMPKSCHIWPVGELEPGSCVSLMCPHHSLSTSLLSVRGKCSDSSFLVLSLP